MTKEDRSTRYVVCAAIRDNDTGKITCGPRHHHCIRTIVDGGEEVVDGLRFEQGFVDQRNEFMTRQEAMLLAKENNQIRYKQVGNWDSEDLYSEHLY